MASTEIRAEVVQKQLQRVLESPGFVRNERMSRFLRFIVEQQLDGRESELKESLIGIEVFGRKPGFDPQRDSTVRSEAARLRARLAEYYAGVGKGDSLVIELPKGGYTPRFHQPETAAQTAHHETHSRPRLGIALAGLAVVLAAAGWWRFQHESAPIPIAVLPLMNLSHDSGDEYFSDGLTSEIIRNLSIIDGLAVRSQTSSFALKGKIQDVRELGRQLAVDYLLEELVADLRGRIHRPRELTSVLWSPKLWTPRQQARQRALLDATLVPHFERWKTAGVCLEDLNPSEFEDLVGEVLFAAGLKIHKVREAPQGGRDLIARGILIPDEEPIEMAVEVKHRRVVDRPQVQLALYQNRAYPALLFVTSGRFTAGVFQEKAKEENRFRLFLKDGFAVGDLVRTHFSLDAKFRSPSVVDRGAATGRRRRLGPS